jgi:Tfp pilus assembly PilM family ATPase
MSKEQIAGISYSDNIAQTVILETSDDGVEVRHLEEINDVVQSDGWFLVPLFELRKKKNLGKRSKISVALDNASVILLSFPMDSSLNQVQQNGHVHWELSNFVDDFKPNAYVSDVHVLRTWARDRVVEVLAVSVKRSLVYNIQQMLSERKLDLDIIDTNHFGAQHALLMNYPDVRTKSVALVGVTRNRIDAGVISNGRLRDYRYTINSSSEYVSIWLQELSKEFPITDMFFHGPEVTHELIKTLRASIHQSITLLNPFRTLRISPSFSEFDKYIGQEHRFAACVGIAVQQR